MSYAITDDPLGRQLFTPGEDLWGDENNANWTKTVGQLNDLQTYAEKTRSRLVAAESTQSSLSSNLSSVENIVGDSGLESRDLSLLEGSAPVATLTETAQSGDATLFVDLSAPVPAETWLWAGDRRVETAERASEGASQITLRSSLTESLSAGTRMYLRPTGVSAALYQFSSEVGSVLSRVDTVEGKTSEHETRISQTEEEISLQAGRIDETERGITNTQAKLSVTAGKIESAVSSTEYNDLGEAISSLETKIVQQAGSLTLSSFEETLGGTRYGSLLTLDPDGIETRVTDAEAGIDANSTSISQNANAIALKASSEYVDTQLSVTDEQIRASLNTRMDGLEGQIGDNASDLGSLQSDYDMFRDQYDFDQIDQWSAEWNTWNTTTRQSVESGVQQVNKLVGQTDLDGDGTLDDGSFLQTMKSDVVSTATGTTIQAVKSDLVEQTAQNAVFFIDGDVSATTDTIPIKNVRSNLDPGTEIIIVDAEAKGQEESERTYFSAVLQSEVVDGSETGVAQSSQIQTEKSHVIDVADGSAVYIATWAMKGKIDVTAERIALALEGESGEIITGLDLSFDGIGVTSNYLRSDNWNGEWDEQNGIAERGTEGWFFSDSDVDLTGRLGVGGARPDDSSKSVVELGHPDIPGINIHLDAEANSDEKNNLTWSNRAGAFAQLRATSRTEVEWWGASDQNEIEVSGFIMETESLRLKSPRESRKASLRIEGNLRVDGGYGGSSIIKNDLVVEDSVVHAREFYSDNGIYLFRKDGEVVGSLEGTATGGLIWRDFVNGEQHSLV